MLETIEFVPMDRDCGAKKHKTKTLTCRDPAGDTRLATWKKEKREFRSVGETNLYLAEHRVSVRHKS